MVAESFGPDPARYDRTRPSYPDAMVQAIVAAAPGPRILDVGTGTGIAARWFHAAGCTVLGVEVDARMTELGAIVDAVGGTFTMGCATVVVTAGRLCAG